MSTLRTAKQLADAKLIKPEAIETVQKIIEKFSVSLPSALVEILKTGSPAAKEAIQKQFLPDEAELMIKSQELVDPIGDNTHTKVKGIIHRYPDRCLLIPITACLAYCRFCFRREKVGTNSKALTQTELKAAYAYIAEHPEIWEVILSGGDPLVLKPKVLEPIFQSLVKIEHVGVIRIHTRTPLVAPERITTDLLKALKITKAVYVVLHVNHPSELTEAVKVACARFVDTGIPLLSQTVLLKGINDDPDILGELMRTLVRNRIKPYYLHHADIAEGTSHFRTTIEKGQSIIKSLRGRYSGLCQPTYVLDIPGGAGKIPIGGSYIKAQAEEDYLLEDWQGRLHRYQAGL